MFPLAEINTEKYIDHSTCFASTSKAALSGLGVPGILARDQWSRKPTWHKFYYTPIEGLDGFQSSVLHRLGDCKHALNKE